MDSGGAILLAAALLAPPGALVGMLFTALASATGASGMAPARGIASLYVFESLGSLAGGLAMTFLVVPSHGPAPRGRPRGRGGPAPCPAVDPPGPRSLLGGAGGAFEPGQAFLPWRGLLATSAIALVLLAMPPVADRLENSSLKVRFGALAPGVPLLDWIDTPYQHAELGGDAGVKHLYAGGQYAGSFPDAASSEALAHTLACLSPSPARILAIGAVAPGPLRFLLLHPVVRVDFTEPDTRYLRWLRRHLPPEDAAAIEDTRVRIIPDDPRRHLATTEERYDLILVLEPDPVTLALARTTTQEFYALASSRLARDGVMVVGLRTAPNELTGETAALGGAIFGALRGVFPVVRAGPGPDGLLVAGFDPGAATLDPFVLAQRWRARAISSERFAPEMFGVLFPAERVHAQEKALADAARSVAPSRDQRPVSFLYALARRERISGGAAGRALASIARLPRPLLALFVFLPSLAALGGAALLRTRAAPRAESRRPGEAPGRPRRHLPARRAPSRPLSVAALHAVLVTGACGMTWSLLLLFSYQTRAGALYSQIGLLTALFMLGLAAGAAIAARAASPRADRPASLMTAARGMAPGGLPLEPEGPSPCPRPPTRPGISGSETGAATDPMPPAEPERRALLAASFGALLFSLLLAAALTLPALSNATVASGFAEPLYGGLLLLAGMATGAVFPIAASALLIGGRSGSASPSGAVTAGPARTDDPEEVGFADTWGNSSVNAGSGSSAAAVAAARAGGAIESADHAGAAVAAIAAALIFVPVFGVGGAAWLLAGLQLLALAGIALTPRSRG